MNPCVVVLFRNDLRVEDHLPLTLACQSGFPVIGLFVFEKYLFTQTTHYRFPKTGPFRTKFLIESVDDLKQQLDDIHIPLFVDFGITHDVLSEVRNSLRTLNFQPTTVYYSEEFGSEEQEVISEAKECHAELSWHSSWTKGLFRLEDVPASDRLPNLFTTFRNQVEKNIQVEKPLAKPIMTDAKQLHFFKQWQKNVPFKLPTYDVLGVTEPEHDERASLVFNGGSSSGNQRVERYFFETKAIHTYKETRNGLLNENDSSKFSPWLANGSISARIIYQQLKKYEETFGKNESTYWMFFELLWREFFLLTHRKYGDKLFVRAGIQNRTKNWTAVLDQKWKWQKGETGYPLVDASMEELNRTGFTSNRARQNAASFLTQTWNIDWIYGAEYYESMLIDYDPALNYGNWQYLAGVGNDARGDRVFNVSKQAERYDVGGQFVQHWKK